VAHDPRAIANKILDIADQKGVTLTIMQLIKLVYFAHGWSLALLKRPLSKHQAQAWQYGPVFPKVYQAFRQFGTRPVSGRAEFPLDDSNGQFSPDEVAIIEQVVDSYGKKHAFILSDITHVAGGPWELTMKDSGEYQAIPNDLITAHFASKVQERAAS
jgi:uncharacterized phage-associated protein